MGMYHKRAGQLANYNINMQHLQSKVEVQPVLCISVGKLMCCMQRLQNSVGGESCCQMVVAWSSLSVMGAVLHLCSTITRQGSRPTVLRARHSNASHYGVNAWQVTCYQRN